VRLLLDTHIALWAVSDDPKLSRSARRLIEDRGNDLFVSTVSLLEIAIKRARRPASLGIGAAQARDLFLSAGYALLPVFPDHAIAVEALPATHPDPFDRLLVAQALSEPLRLLTHDRALAAYNDACLLA
jgi:PIN domain nuclease of toxin-antitoxin system